VQEIRNSVKIIKKNEIDLTTYYILGHPHETEETIKKTINLAAELNTDSIAVGIMVPYPGTRIYDMALKDEGGYHLISSNWEDYDKYGGKALELKNIAINDLKKWQRRAYLYLYVKNYRIIDLIKYIYHRRSALKFFLKKTIIDVLHKSINLISHCSKKNI
jgi:anaerobic magnesium-protoporphyrin IX monomethyl ester cyclase